MASATAEHRGDGSGVATVVQVLDYFGVSEDTLVTAERDIRPCKITAGILSSEMPVDLRGDYPDAEAACRYLFDRRPA